MVADNLAEVLVDSFKFVNFGKLPRLELVSVLEAGIFDP